MYDTIIIGGGPAGTTIASLLRKYDPNHRVLILERERFPRDHVGESQLPVISAILDEMGVWDKVEEANFPVKIGATYRWGSTPSVWHFNFLPNAVFREEPRPAKYTGQRTATAFQVDRAIYDKILLDHAELLGAEIRQETKVVEVLKNEDAVTGLKLHTDEIVTAKHYVDCSGGAGILRRKMGVEIDSPTTLRNIAIWDYWQNAEWQEEIGVGGTRIQVLSLGYGWIWFIPLGPTRTSVGFVVPAAYFKKTGLKPSKIYQKALADEPRVAALLAKATSEGKLTSTNDWSYVSGRMAGTNWFLAGDSCGFADPILSAGMTLAHSGAREVAYSILAIEKEEHDAEWLKKSYDEQHRKRILQHIRFADYWYSANGQFSELVEYTSEIAKDAGLDLDPDKAFQWLGTGGFANDGLHSAAIGTFSVSAIKQMSQILTDGKATWRLNEVNELRLDMRNVKEEPFPIYEGGQIYREKQLVKGRQRLPLVGPFLVAYVALAHERDLRRIISFCRQRVPGNSPQERDINLLECLQAFEAMLSEGWIKGTVNKKNPVGLGLEIESNTPLIQYDQAR